MNDSQNATKAEIAIETKEKISTENNEQENSKEKDYPMEKIPPDFTLCEKHRVNIFINISWLVICVSL